MCLDVSHHRCGGLHFVYVGIVLTSTLPWVSSAWAEAVVKARTISRAMN